MNPCAMSEWMLGRGVESRTAALQRPRPRLLLAGREEGQEARRFEDPARHVLERRGPVAELRSLLLRKLRELRLELHVDP